MTSSFAADADVVAAIGRHVAETPERVALHWLADLADDTATMTYADLDASAGVVAADVLEVAQPGDRVLLVLPPGLGFVSAFVGCLYAGAVPVPVYPMLDSAEGVGAIRRIAADCGASLLLAPDEETADLASGAVGVPATWPHGALREPPRPPVPPETPAFLQYTSGSTASPKGVVVTRGNLAANVQAIAHAFGHDQDTVILSWLPSYHDMGLIGNILHPLHAGIPVYLTSPLAFVRRPLAWLEAVERYGVTTTGGPNFAYELVLSAIDRRGLPDVDLSGWRRAYNGAEPVAARTLRRFSEALAPRGFRAEVFLPCYGLAESTLLVSSVAPGSTPVLRTAADGTTAVSCGLPRDCEVAVVDGDGRSLPDGEVGEILVSGPSVAAGYWKAPEATAATFHREVLGRSGRWLATGDLGFLAGDDELHVTGRLKDVIVVHGRSHHAHDVEQVATEVVDAFRPGNVVAFADAPGTGVVVAAELRPGRVLDPGDRVRLATAVTSALGIAVTDVVTVPRGGVPRTTSGKLRRSECRLRYLDGRYDRVGGAPTDAPTGRRGAAPGETVRAVLASALSDVLAAVPPDDEPLVAHGLDSLGALRVAGRLADAGVDLPVSVLLSGRSLAEVGRVAGGADSEAGVRPGAGDPAAAGGALAPAQEALLFVQQMHPEGDQYTISYAVEPGAGTDLAAFEAALRGALLRQTELAVRLVVDHTGARREPLPRRRMDEILALVPVPVREERLPDQLSDAASLPFDLSAGPLLRVYAWQTPSRRVYQVVAHHIGTDLWSLSLALRDLAAGYAAARAGVPATLPDPVPYERYLDDQATYLASPEAAARDELLRRLLPTRAEALGVRTDRPRAGSSATAAGRVRTTVDVALAARPAGTDRVAFLTALWAACLSRYGTPNPVVVGVPVTGRPHGRHAEVRGLCTNTVPLAVEIDPGAPLPALVQETRRQLDAGMDAAFYPLTRAVQAVRPLRASGRAPLVETLVTVHENPLPEAGGLLAALAGEPSTLELGELTLHHVPVTRHSGRCDLDLVVTSTDGDGLLLTLDHAEVFDRRTAEAILETYAAMVVAGAGAPAGAVAGTFVRPEEHRQLLEGFARTQAAPRGSIVDDVLRVAAADPAAPAVVADGQVTTFAELVAGVEVVATALEATLDGGAR